MSHLNDQGLGTLQFYSTASYPCSYLPDRQARSQVAAPTHLIDTPTYSALVERGFRRSGLFTYRPNCDQCRACLSVRVDIARFTASRTQRKVLNRHGNLHVRQMPLHWNAEHFDLYERYQLQRHPGEGMDEDSHAQYTQFLLASRVDSCLVEFREPDGTLRMVSIIDRLSQGWSSVYTFFDPSAAGSLGTYGVLWQIEQCRLLGLPWLYLGYWIRDSRKMSYKSRFQPLQVLYQGVWREANLPE